MEKKKKSAAGRIVVRQIIVSFLPPPQKTLTSTGFERADWNESRLIF